MKTHSAKWYILIIMMVEAGNGLLSGTDCIAQRTDRKIPRTETVLDRLTHLTEPLVTEIPKVERLCDQSGTLKKQYVDIGDCRLYVETEGAGIPIVLINGGPGGTHHDFHPFFSRAAEFAKVIYYDQRGCGLSDYAGGKDGYTFPQAVEDLDKLREALRIDKWITVGWSYGGCLAQNYLLQYPDHVAGLVLVGASNATPLSLDKTRQYDFMTAEEKNTIRAIWNNANLTDEQQLFNAHMYGDWKRQNFYRPTAEQLARMALYEWKHDKGFCEGISATLNLIEIPKLFDKCPIPVLVFEGAWDLTWNTDKPEKLHSVFPGSKLVVLKQSGHKMFGDEPEMFFSTLKEFVSTRRMVKDADIALWKSNVENSRKRMEDEANGVSDEETYRTVERAPGGFTRWSFFWESPKVDEGAKVGYVVVYDDAKEYYRWGPKQSDPEGSPVSSDFQKEWTGKDPSVLYGKEIRIKFRTTKGKISLAKDITFEFRDKDGKVIKQMNGVKVGE